MQFNETIEYILENVKDLDLELLDKEKNIQQLEKDIEKLERAAC